MPLRRETLTKYVTMARDKIIEIAKKGDTITYKELMEKMGGPGRGYIGEVLEEICQREHEEGRPLLSALVVHSNDRLPGDAFWKLSLAPQHVTNGAREDKINFWRNEQRKIYEYWRK